MIYLMLGFILLSSTGMNAQVIIGSTEDPDIDAVLELVSNDKLGLLLPRLKLTDILSASPLSEHKEGMVVYNLGNDLDEDGNEISSDALPAGYYYNDGQQWVQITDSNIAAWKSIATKEMATDNAEDIYQMGAVVIGNSELENNAQFVVVSEDKGVLFPRMRTEDRNNIGSGNKNEIPDGLLIYNIDTHCYNYFNKSAAEWVSLCGKSSPAMFTLEDCSFASFTPIGSGSYKVGQALTSNHTYTIKVRVERAGTYNIVLSSGNGYSFTKSGEFSAAGVTQTIVLAGQGVPLSAGTDNNFTLSFNGQVVNVTCQLPAITVVGTEGQFVIVDTDCNSKIVAGSYQKGRSVTASTHYVEVAIFPVQDMNNMIIEAVPVNGANGLTFRSDPLTMSAAGGKRTIRLYASGTPINKGTYTYRIKSIPEVTICDFTIEVSSDLGSFQNPAKSCLALYNDGERTDGEYWIQQRAGSNSSVKTRCDMTNGGYTLIFSFSEKTAYEGGSSSGNPALYLPKGDVRMNKAQHQLRNDYPSNVVTSESGEIQYEDFRLSLTTMQNVKTQGDYRVQISYDPKKDYKEDFWARGMYANITPPVSVDFISRTYKKSNAVNFVMEGKIFNKTIISSGGNVYFDGMVASGTHDWYNNTYHATHLNFGYSFKAGGNTLFSTNLKKIDGSDYSYTFSTKGFNNMFGWFSEHTGDHQFGKCGSNDYANGHAGDNNGCGHGDKTPHSFNNGQGRYLQWWVK